MGAPLWGTPSAVALVLTARRGGLRRLLLLGLVAAGGLLGGGEATVTLQSSTDCRVAASGCRERLHLVILLRDRGVMDDVCRTPCSVARAGAGRN